MAEIRTCTQEFRDSAVQMVKDQGMSIPKAAAGLGIPPNTLRGWVEAASGAKPSASTRAAHRGTAGSDAALQQRVRELEAENRQLRIDREILKERRRSGSPPTAATACRPHPTWWSAALPRRARTGCGSAT